MTLDTYAGLKTEIAAWLYNRADLEGAIDSFIALAHAEIDARVRHRLMLTRAELVLDGELTDLPQDYRGIRGVRVGGLALEACTPETLAREDGDGRGGRSRYAVLGSQLQVRPAPAAGTPAQVLYLAAIPALSEAAPDNWVLARHPGAYLYGALTQAAPYLAEDERTAVWGRLFLDMLAAINAQGRDEAHGPASVRPGMSII